MQPPQQPCIATPDSFESLEEANMCNNITSPVTPTVEQLSQLQPEFTLRHCCTEMDARFVENTLHSTTRQIPCSICPLFFPASLSPRHSRQLQPQLDHEGQPPSQDLLPSYQQYIYMRIDHRIMGTRV